MSKLPAFQFYPSDWKNDIKVQSLNFTEKGIWFEILCLMHESEERGKLVINGYPMDDTTIARLIGCEKNVFTKVLSKLISSGVAYKDDKGVIYNKRMVNDHKLIQIRRECGKKGGNPNLVNQTANQKEEKQSNLVNQTVNQIPTPSFASAFASSAKQLSREKVFEILRNSTDRNAITDKQVQEETENFVKKYSSEPIHNLSALVKSFAERIQPKQDPAKVKIVLK